MVASSWPECDIAILRGGQTYDRMLSWEQY
jgi:hypothetical protein